ncbi:outer membrane protein [Microvirga brassicacearum]|uniref:Porin family protein n=1 Tax=Microvirga brassicacearum TaxID=2580413 RepID=A0A5N3PIR1_9HYPH|nr:outer membrane protein [Microvirga brassicacearum]KAB0269563.1 porin family protein [Microvirga brassicacearum]
MKKILLSTVAFVGLTVSAAAADLPSRAAPAMMAPVPVFTWTGFYVGVNAGYGWNANDNNDLVDPITGIAIGGGGDDGGFVGGAQLGYNYQMGMFVLGAETDIQYADLGNRIRFEGLGVIDNGSDNEFFGTTRLRAGVAFDRFLAYATGGVAYADSNFGWTVGAGVEYAFTNNLTAKVEGLYVNLDGDDDRNFGIAFAGNNNNEFGVVRAGLNYKFSSY